MYAVVGCRECHALWIVEGRPETTRCPRCRRRHQFESLRAFAETETSEAAARVRSSMLAERADDGEFVDPDEIDVESVGVDEVEFLAASGVDADAVAAAGERAEGGTERSRSRKQVLLDSVAELDEPTRDDIVAHATAAGIPEARVERALEKLHRNGELTRSDGVYREL
jgi:hypothetical protein